MPTFKYLVAMRNEYYEQYLDLIDVESKTRKEAYRKLRALMRDRVRISLNTFEKARQISDHQTELKASKLLCSARSETDSATYEEIHRDLYAFLRCPRDRDALSSRLRELASDGHLPNFGWPGGYPIVYYKIENDEIISLCGDCANREDPPEKHGIVDYAVLEGDVRDHGEVICDECYKHIIPEEEEEEHIEAESDIVDL